MLCSSLGALRHSAGAQQAPKGLAALKGRSDTHKALRGCAALSRSAAVGTQQAVPRSGGAQALTRRSGAVQRSGGAQQRAPSWRCSAQQALRRPAGTQELHSAQGALSGAQGASRWCSAQGALCDAQGRSGVAQGRSGAHQVLRGRAMLSRRLAGGTGAVQCSRGAHALSWRSGPRGKQGASKLPEAVLCSGG